MIDSLTGFGVLIQQFGQQAQKISTMLRGSSSKDKLSTHVRCEQMINKPNTLRKAENKRKEGSPCHKKQYLSERVAIDEIAICTQWPWKQKVHEKTLIHFLPGTSPFFADV